ncbi:hypothetical protein D6C80_04570 [Aureobasidium pullulans]|nr:hypothetical protein D6C80_04570 [Aureobasidium pullulans]
MWEIIELSQVEAGDATERGTATTPIFNKLRSAITFLPGALTIAPSSSGGNTTASNTQQQQPNTTGLFGQAPAASSQPQQSGGLFGASTATSQPQQSGGLFGNTSAAPAAKPTLSLFGNTQSSTSTSQPQQQQSGGLFGGATANNNNTSTTGGLFGGTTANNTTANTGGLFGGAAANNTSSNTGGMFGSSTQNQAQPQNNNAGLFGAPKPAPPGLFGSSTAQQSNNNFGSSLLNPLGGSTVRPLAGSLTMGQGNTAQSSTQPGVKIDLSNLRPTTRFSDLHDDLKKQIEFIETSIRKQENYATQCEAMIVGHAANVESIKPDVDLIQNKIETVELALENDGAAIANAKELVQRDAGDLIRVARMAENLQLPQQYHYGRSSRPSTTDDEYDIDLVGYFGKQAEVMQKTLDTYTSHLAEIEAHLRVVEGSTVQQAHQLAAQRTGGRAGNSSDNVRELAETLRGFESGILGAAGLVGSCREGVNELILGKIGSDPRESVGYGGRKSVRF